MKIKQNEHCYIEYGKDDINEQHRKINGELRKEIKRLEDNWNKLRENIKRRKEKFDSGLWCELDVMRMFNYLINELENGDSDE